MHAAAYGPSSWCECRVDRVGAGWGYSLMSATGVLSYCRTMDTNERNTDIVWLIGIALSGFAIFVVWTMISVLWVGMRMM